MFYCVVYGKVLGKVHEGASFMAHWIKPSLGVLTSRIRVPVQALIAMFLIQLPANRPGNAVENGSSAWPLPSMWKIQMKFWTPSSHYAVVAIWKMNTFSIYMYVFSNKYIYIC